MVMLNSPRKEGKDIVYRGSGLWRNALAAPLTPKAHICGNCPLPLELKGREDGQ